MWLSIYLYKKTIYWELILNFEYNDFSAKRPFTVEYSIEQSLAIYAWLENNDLGNSGDIDVFVFRKNEPANVSWKY